MSNARSDGKHWTEQPVPVRVMVVDDEEASLNAMVRTLANQNIEIVRATDAEEALTMLARQWIPVVVTDEDMPIMDGIELTRRVRSLAVQPTYVIMITSKVAGADLEKGYCAGVDHYISKSALEATLAVRVNAGLKAIRQRRAVRRELPNHGIVTVDLASGAHTARHLVGRLNAEIMLAQHRSRTVDLAILGVDPATHNAREPVNDEQLAAVLAAIHGAVRDELDWVAWLHASGRSHRFAIVVPNSVKSTAPFEQHIRNAFAVAQSDQQGAAPKLSFGTASFRPSPDTPPPGALDFLAMAERARRGANDTVKKTVVEVVQPNAE